MWQKVLPAYGLNDQVLKIETFGNGLINNTWQVVTADRHYILQRVNPSVFKKPADIAHNIREIADYLGSHYPEYEFVAPLAAVNGEEMVCLNGEDFFRLFPFVQGSHSKEVVETPEQAYEAARQFGRFTRLLSNFEVQRLRLTIPDFHNLNLRYRQFLNALQLGNPERLREAHELIRKIQDQADIVAVYDRIVSDGSLRLRVTHHDTKISNVLFNSKGEGLCVIDLDTVMPGYFISDVGDMMRTYLSPVSEEEKDLSSIEVRDSFYKAIVQGYVEEMQGELSRAERMYFFYAGKFMIYMQALRFLTDYLNNDVYYGSRYSGHNLTRAHNQIVLLERLNEKEAQFSSLL